MNYSRPFASLKSKHWLVVGALLIVAVLIWRVTLPGASGAQLGNRSLKLGDAGASVHTDYNLSFDIVTSGTLGSILVQFCSNDPEPNTACTAPTGFDDGAASLAAQTGPGGFSISPASTANELILTRVPASASAGTASFHFVNVQNPSQPSSYFVRVLTYASNDTTGSLSDDGGLAFAINNPISLTAEVPPYLTFCTGITIAGLNCANAVGDFVDFGELSTQQARKGSSQMLVVTNAGSGYAISATGTTLTSGNNFIANLAGGDVSRSGTPQFGFNLRANSAPAVGADPAGPGVGTPTGPYNQPNFYRFASGDTVATHFTSENPRLYTISYITNVPPSQSPGIYVSTITYICVATF